MKHEANVAAEGGRPHPFFVSVANEGVISARVKKSEKK
jgi:hypothetical protein